MNLKLKLMGAAGINPDVALESYTMNITTLRGYAAFKDSLVVADGRSSRVDLVLSCVDNYEARMTINEVCLSEERQLPPSSRQGMHAGRHCRDRSAWIVSFPKSQP